MDENERYTLVCKERFDRLEDKLDEVMGLLRGRNSKPGLLDDMRMVKRISKAFCVGLAVIFAQMVAWVFRKFS